MILAAFVLFQYPIYHRVFTNAVHQAAYTTRLFSWMDVQLSRLDRASLVNLFVIYQYAVVHKLPHFIKPKAELHFHVYLKQL